MTKHTFTGRVVVFNHNDADLPLFPFETLRHTLEHEGRRLVRKAEEEDGHEDRN